jgi:hypothetical protein
VLGSVILTRLGFVSVWPMPALDLMLGGIALLLILASPWIARRRRALRHRDPTGAVIGTPSSPVAATARRADPGRHHDLGAGRLVAQGPRGAGDGADLIGCVPVAGAANQQNKFRRDGRVV